MMSFGWILGLALVTFLAYPISQGTNAAAQVAVLVFFGGSVVLYFVPTIVAHRRGHTNATSITLLNVFLGWTLLGWVAAIVWAFSAQKPAVVALAPAPPAPLPADQNAAIAPQGPPSVSTTKKCPFCAEDIKAEAIKCKHCGSDLAAA